MTQTVKLTVVNDVVCANCFMGRKELMNAISHCTNTLHLPLTFEVEHSPFRLISTGCLPDDPPPESKVDKKTFYISRIGKDAFDAIEDFSLQWGKQNGVHLSFAGPMSQSTHTHRLVQRALQIGGRQLQCSVLSHIFKANFQDDRDIGDVNVLADIAAQEDMMTLSEALDFLLSDELKKEVEEMSDKVRKCGIDAVPVTIINGKWTVNGAVPADAFIKIFKKLADGKDHSPVPEKL